MDLPPADSSSNCHRWQRTWGWGRAGPGQGRGKPGGHRGPGPQELNGSRAPAPDLGAAEAAWTCSVFALPRPEQLAPACRCLQGEAPRDAAARLPPPCPARARLAAHQVGALSAWGDFSPGPETAPRVCRPRLLHSQPISLALLEKAVSPSLNSTWQQRCSDSKTVVWLVGRPGPAQLGTGSRLGAARLFGACSPSQGGRRAPGSFAAGETETSCHTISSPEHILSAGGSPGLRNTFPGTPLLSPKLIRHACLPATTVHAVLTGPGELLGSGPGSYTGRSMTTQRPGLGETLRLRECLCLVWVTQLVQSRGGAQTWAWLTLKPGH